MAGDFDLSDSDYEESYKITEKGLGYLEGLTEERVRIVDLIRQVAQKYKDEPVALKFSESLLSKVVE